MCFNLNLTNKFVPKLSFHPQSPAGSKPVKFNFGRNVSLKNVNVFKDL